MNINVDENSTNSTSLYLFWWMPVPNNVTFQFLPSIATVGPPNPVWKNASKWIEDTTGYQFFDLEPFTRYNLTVYVRVKGKSEVYAPAK